MDQRHRFVSGVEKPLRRIRRVVEVPGVRGVDLASREFPNAEPRHLPKLLGEILFDLRPGISALWINIRLGLPAIELSCERGGYGR